MWYVYVLLCEDGSLYTGISPDPVARFEQHKVGKGGKYTRSHKPVQILFTEEHTSRSHALKREAYIKKLSREKKISELSLPV